MTLKKMAPVTRKKPQETYLLCEAATIHTGQSNLKKNKTGGIVFPDFKL